MLFRSEYVSRETLTMGQVRPLLALDKAEQQLEVANAIIEKGWSARTVEEVVQQLKQGNEIKLVREVVAVIMKNEKKEEKKPKNQAFQEANLIDFQNKLVELLGTKVKIVPKSDKQGKIEIEYYSVDDLERIYDVLQMKDGKTYNSEEKNNNVFTV